MLSKYFNTLNLSSKTVSKVRTEYGESIVPLMPDDISEGNGLHRLENRV